MNRKLPEKYLDNMKELLKEEFEDYLSSFEREYTPSLRINTSKISVEDFLKISPFHLTPVPWSSDGFYYEEEDHPTKHPYYYAGLYYIQEASAMTPGEIIGVEEGDRVLDCCAAPGGKSTKVLSRLKGTGILFANDLSTSRCRALLKNLELYGGDNYCVLSEDIEVLKKNFSGFFTKILIDAPCSGEGMFHKEPSLITSWEERGNEAYQPVQKKILKDALDLLAPGGRLLYSTCTFSPLEDEDVIAYALSERADIHLIDIPKEHGFQEGVKGLKECARLYPHHLRGEGHFLALLEKDGETPKDNNGRTEVSLPEELKDISRPFCNGHFEYRKEKLYFLPDHLKKLSDSRYRILRSGLLIGEDKGKRFEYSQALALSLKKEEYPYVLDLSSQDDRVLRYLKGESISLKEEGLDKKTVLVLTDGYPLGWGRVQGNMMKNLYPKEWRMR